MKKNKASNKSTICRRQFIHGVAAASGMTALSPFFINCSKLGSFKNRKSEAEDNSLLIPSLNKPPESPADWLVRSKQNGVVWAHNFESDAEVSNHLAGSADPKAYSVPPRRVVDENGTGCLEQLILGAELSQNYTAGSNEMCINDSTHWPDPAVTCASFYFHVCKQHPNGRSKNMFLCTA